MKNVKIKNRSTYLLFLFDIQINVKVLPELGIVNIKKCRETLLSG